MKVNRDGVKGLSSLYKDNSVRAGGQQQGTGSQVVGKSDQVTVSEHSRQVATMRQALSDQPEVRKERIAQLTAAIARGEYHVDSRKLAEKLLKAKVLD